ncbi:MAG TPA: STM3941 family protein [Tepidisphaeraceae bacterium]|nr:STM3941 family protein [Tepidisphaeraceae bacterium]
MSDILGTVRQSSPPQGPLLFFVDKRRRRVTEAMIVLGMLTILLALFSWGFARVAGQAPWWAILFLSCVIVLFAYTDVQLILNAFHLIRPGPALILYEEGIHDRRVSKSIIPWNEIRQMRHQKILHDWWMLYFYARNPTVIRRRLRLIHRLPSLISQLTGRGTFMVKFHSLNPGADTALRYLILKLCEHGADPGFPASVENQPQR